MLFNSFAFVVLLLITFALYYAPRMSRLQVPVLIISSMIFYAYNQPVLLLLLLLSIAINIFTSYAVTYGNPNFRKVYAILGVVLNLSILLFFKYSPLFGKTLFQETSSIGEFLISIPLPIGISFFTFQGISLVVDVFKENYFTDHEVIPSSFRQHAMRTAFFIGFFPGLVAGPIVKAHDFLPQIKVKHFKDIDWERCFRLLVMGYFLKMVIADNLKEFTFWITYPYFEGLKTASLVALLFGYSFQIFADFAGYSLIAIGLAKLFGYNFKDNFNFPYISLSFKEFWKRWHISLSSFLMEYLYFPLGGNRKGKVRTYINLMVTMILGGLWHGAAWSYAVWGTFHGIALAVERFITDRVKLNANLVVNTIKGAMVFCFVTLAWLLFKLPEFSHVIKYFKAMSVNEGLLSGSLLLYIMLYSLPVVLYHVNYLVRERMAYEPVRRMEYIPYGLMLFLIVTNSGPAGAFIYFQF
ncbi:MAG TPA: MBOAT family O-acyltransferase [Cyclobacteriaceae bacterium]|nr:MBOAT family O-acyltransferase [Cyclobacteriaceae bacterium]